MRSTAVSSVCASERRAIASPTTSSSARVRSSSRLDLARAARRRAARAPRGPRRRRAPAARRRPAPSPRGRRAGGRRTAAGRAGASRRASRRPGRSGVAARPRPAARCSSASRTSPAARVEPLLGSPRTRASSTCAGVRPRARARRPARRSPRRRPARSAAATRRGVAARGERVAGELEPRAARDLPRSERVSGPSVRTASASCEAASSASARSSSSNGSPIADQLDATRRTRSPARAGDEREGARRVDALRRPLRRLRDRAGREHVAGRPRAGDLGGERRALRRDRARDEVAGAVEDAHDRQVGAASLRRRPRERRQGARAGPSLAAISAAARASVSTGRRPASTTITCQILPGLQSAAWPSPPASRSSRRTRRRSIRSRSSGTTAASAPAAAPRSSAAARCARSDVRFWVTLLVLAFFAAFVILAAWHEVQTLFGV